ncbi:hypothetical protein D3C87_1066600 [compost metagenome]
MLGRLEQRPEIIADHVRGDLTTTHWPTDKGAHKVLGVIEHELIARLGRNRFEGGERVGPALWPIARQRIDLPVAAVEQALDPRQLRRTQRIGDVGLVHDHTLHRPQAIVKLRARIIVRATGVDQVNRLAGRGARTHPLEEMPRLAILEVEMGEKPVLVQPAPHQTFPGARRIEQVFPLHHLQGFPGAGRQRLLIDRRAGRQPALQRLVLLVGQAGHRQRHALLRMLGGITVELRGHGTHVFPVQAQDDVLRQLRIRLQRSFVAKLQHPRHQCSLAALGIEHRIKALLLPGLFAGGVIEQSGRCNRLAAVTVVDRDFGCATCRALTAAQVELTGGVIAGVAGHALFSEDRLNVTAV